VANSRASVLVGAEDVRGVKIVAGEIVVAVVAVAGWLGGPGVQTSWSNDRFELMERHQDQSKKSRGGAH
jgi:hypothetical protein